MTYTPAFDEAAAKERSPGITSPSDRAVRASLGAESPHTGNVGTHTESVGTHTESQRAGAVSPSAGAVNPSDAVVSPHTGSLDTSTDSHGSSKGRARRALARPTSLERGPLDLRNTWQVVLGSLLIPLGVIFILLAWYGAAHARVVQQQIPYLISGAFIGLGCMVVGGLLYWAHWLYRIYDQAELLHTEQLQAMRELVVALSGESSVATRSSDDLIPSHSPAPSGSAISSSSLSSSEAPHLLDVTADAASASASAMTPGQRRKSMASGPSGLVMHAEPPIHVAPRAEHAAEVPSSHSTAGVRRDPEPMKLVATATGSVYHLADCPIVLSHGEGLRQLDPQEAASLHPCRLCGPSTALD